MSVKNDSPEGYIIRKMIPFSTMPNHIFKVICEKIVVENVRSGTFLFKRGDTNNELIYLLKGEISLEALPLKIEVIKEGSESARFAIAHQFPRKIDAVAKSTVRFLRLNTLFINPPDATAFEKKEQYSIKVAKKSESIDCFATLLMIPIIRSLPPDNLQKISKELEEIRIKKDQIIIEQGTLGDYYYLIKHGECLVTYQKPEDDLAVKVATLQTWNTFGGGGLISGELRTETVTALSDMILLRLPKDNFLTLIKQPSLTFIDFIELELWLDKGAVLLDVNLPNDYEKRHLPKAINIPLFTLPIKLKSLDKSQQYIIICKDGKFSESAAFLMKSDGFSVKIIKGGLNKIPQATLLDPQQILNKINANNFSVDKMRSMNLDEKGDSLENENKNLKQTLVAIKEKYTQADDEKKQWEEKYKMLVKEIETDK